MLIKWSPVLFEPLSSCYWEGEDLAVIYNATCGDTHLVSPVAIDLLEAIRTHPKSSTIELADQFSVYFDCDTQEAVISSLDEVLHQLLAIGIVRADQS